MRCDFSGYATKNDLKCADGRIIRHDAFKENDGKVVPLVWQHVHNDPTNVLGHALLENRDDGVYAYGTFNGTPSGQHAKKMVENGDISSMSIYANRLKQEGNDVIHGMIREVSLVLAGANPGALIDNISFAHADGSYTEVDDEAVIYNGFDSLDYIVHSDESENIEEDEEDSKNDDIEEVDMDEEITHADDNKTVQDVFDTLSEDQKQVVYYIIGQAIEDNKAEHDDIDEGDTFMKHNVFDGSVDENADVLSHDELNAVLADATHSSSLRDTFLEHGIENLDILFPEARNVTPTPEMISRRMEWVSSLWGGLKKSPFSRIKSTAADITMDEARAKGYIKGNKKTEEQFSLLSRVTTPQTIYKKQKLDRDDVIDITDIDVVAWLKQEMRMMLDEEICRAVLVGDGRLVNSPDHIKHDNVRPIFHDADTYTIHYNVSFENATNDDDKSAALVDSAIRARKDYRGSGNPKFYATNEIITQMLLARDKIGRRLYKDMGELASALRVTEVVEVPVLEGITRTDEESGSEVSLLALIFNPGDYTIGADKGGAVSMFDDFDIDYNQMKYLIETRISGALTKPFSAISLETAVTGDSTSTTPESNPEGE